MRKGRSYESSIRAEAKLFDEPLSLITLLNVVSQSWNIQMNFGILGNSLLFSPMASGCPKIQEPGSTSARTIGCTVSTNAITFLLGLCSV